MNDSRHETLTLTLTRAQYNLACDQIAGAREDQGALLVPDPRSFKVRGTSADLWTLLERMGSIAEACDEQGDWRQAGVARRVVDRIHDTLNGR